MKTYRLEIEIRAECKSDALERIESMDKDNELESYKLLEDWS